MLEFSSVGYLWRCPRCNKEYISEQVNDRVYCVHYYADSEPVEIKMHFVKKVDT